MIKKKLGVFIAPALILGLAACNNDNDNAFDNTNGKPINTTANVDENLYRVNNRYPFDHQGPLAENYNRNKRNHLDGRDRTAIRTNPQRNIDVNYRKNNRNNAKISSYRTSKNSDAYPHTKAVLVQEARYQFIPVNPNQDTQRQTNLRHNNETVQTPEIQQRLKQQAQALLQQQQQQSLIQQQQQQQQQAQTQEEQPQAQTQQPTQKTPENVNQAVQQVIDLTNQQRKQNGLPALQTDTKLNSVAQKKSEDMQQNGYFSHTSPTYGSPFDMMRDFDISYKSAGENIAQGQRTPQEVVQSWMNSEGHRRNILSKDFTHIGVGYESTGHHWTQMFISK